MSSNNPCSEALLRTCKYRPDWPKGFCNQAQAQSWVKRSADWYNGEPPHSVVRFVTPNARHARRSGTGEPQQAIPSLCKGPCIESTPLTSTEPKKPSLSLEGDRSELPVLIRINSELRLKSYLWLGRYFIQIGSRSERNP